MEYQNTAFIVYRLPGSTELFRYEFSNITPYKLIYGEVSVEPWCTETLRMTMEVCARTTDKEHYLSSLSTLITKLRGSSHKAVISRLICGSFDQFAPKELMEQYFQVFPNSFCFMFYHPITGYWMGASPELLLETETPYVAKTRALAGTKQASDSAPWSEKNIEEHNIVVEDIISRLSALVDISVKRGSVYDLKYASVRHLCTPITISSKLPLPTSEIVHTLHPTPAVCGYPRDKALEFIKETEDYPRNCYGGLITVPSSKGPVSYVILRCVHFDNKRWAIYTGSGITHASDPMDEWLETEAKASPLVKLLTSF